MLKVEKVSSPPFEKTMLKTEDCFILDVGSEIFVWVGKGCTKQEKLSSMFYAQQFLLDSGRPDWIPITRLVQGAETPIFKSQFYNWKEENASDGQDYAAYERGNIAPTKQQKAVDLGTLVSPRGIQKENINIHKEGKVTIWRIENFKHALIPKEQYGVFYSGDSYIVLFEHHRLKPITFYWLGRDSSPDEKGAATLLIKEIVEDSKHIRVAQGKEPRGFLNLFDGKCIFKLGGVSGYKRLLKNGANRTTFLYHVKGTCAEDTRAVEVEPLSRNLNSADCFVLNDSINKILYIWYGKGSETIEQKHAKICAQFIIKVEDLQQAEIKEFHEDQEPHEFWDLLGGKTEYLNFPELQHNVKEPRLYHCSNSSGTFQVEELYNWSQEDLMMDDIFILDIFSCVFVWVGPESNDIEKKMSYETALAFVEKAAELDGRPRDTKVVRVLPGCEPALFTCWFQGWKSGSGDAYERNLALLKEAQANTQAIVDVREALQEIVLPEGTTFPYAVLCRRPLPNQGKGFDMSRLEYYLTDDEFFVVFNMTKGEWEKCREWKKMEIKKKLALF
eukprot:TRINITY_DN6517_c0_g1_i1.p1 TRINITY_DN6517_c0_g1~~TRINITY_DN6517_c0_g1_i1.p1  ORF type:complete len:621 (+),score=193.20 TRINITY_DN6517_c0_g1_i1:188-1864(+)